MVNLFIITLLVFSNTVRAIDNSTESAKKNKDKNLFIDTTHDVMSRGLFAVTNSIDQFFGNIKSLDEKNGTRFRLFNISSKVESGNFLNKTEMRIRLKLPNLENRLRIVIEKNSEDIDKKVPTPESQSATNIDQNQDDVRVGAEFIEEKINNWNLRLTSGLNITIPPEFAPYTRLRARYQKTLLKGWLMRFIIEPFWNRQEGFGETNILDFDYPISNDLLFRFGNDATWRDDTDFFRFSHGPSLFHRISDRRAMAYSLKMNGKTKPINQVESYDMSISYRQLIYKNWFFYEIIPFGGYAKERNWKFQSGASFKLELIIGDI